MSFIGTKYEFPRDAFMAFLPVGAEPPSGPAGGVLSGNYPNPAFAFPIVVTGTNVVQFGATALATIGVSADTTSGNLVLTGTSTGSIGLSATATYLPSTATSGLQLYNTADQVTNYQRLALKYSGSIALIGTDTGTTAANTALQLYSQSANNGNFIPRQDFVVSAGNTAFRQGYFTTTTGTGLANVGTAANHATFGQGSYTSTSGTNNIVSIIPTYNQASGNSSNSDFVTNRTQTQVGIGLQKLADLQVGGTSWYSFATGNTAVTGGFNSSSTVEPAVTFAPVINQSGTAGYTALKVYSTETATGSGTKLLADFGVGGSTKFSVDNGGNLLITNGNGSVTSTGNLFLNPSATASLILSNKTVSAASTGIVSSLSSFTGASVAQVGVNLNQTVNQTGTSSFTDFLVNRTQTAAGSGTQRLLDLQVGSTSRLNVDNQGQLTALRSDGSQMNLIIGNTQNASGTLAVDTSGNLILDSLSSGKLVKLRTAADMFSVNGAAANVTNFTATGPTETSGAGQAGIGLSLARTINQTSTAAYTAFKIATTETAAGSGAQYSLAGYGGSAGTTNLYSFGNTLYGPLPSGATTAGTGLTIPAVTYTVTGTNTATAFQGNYFGAPTFTNASAGLITDAFNTVFAGPAATAGSQSSSTRSHTLGIVDSTSAASSITGAVVIATTLGTSATSVGIGGGNINAGGTLTVGGTTTLTGAVTQTAKTTTYNNVATAGMGLAVVVANPRQTAVTNTTATLATYTVPAVDSTFRVSANVQVTAATTAAMTVVCTYTDETNTSRAQTIPFCQLAGTFLTSITNVTGVGPYEGATLEIRCKASTTIVFTTAGTVTSITYNVEGVVVQIA